MNDWQKRNQQVIEDFRAHAGHVEGWSPLVLITMKGAKTGQERIVPLMRVQDGDRVLAVASKGGSPKHPEWYNNLVANPDVTVENGHDTYPATARILTGTEREKAFELAAKVFPPYAEYQQKTSREIPVFAIERTAK
ncbi:hypothetical protein KDA_56830 [Dictyobacter alpinus]|uniref:Nitroreductase n=1 Tax=Dictyobacter alpinus TaxID=2014873 RepID=A0A402BFV9_9CHLR|nr:nitroreductase family deazaflavin-dependent oxidoreductase [Dictyobacter alpinus]GCE30199.1 hypothetical protein KDA_56830 [Dictyobacter alpinus]